MNYTYCEKPDDITIDQIADVINTAYAGNKKRGIIFRINHISGAELEQFLKTEDGRCFVALDHEKPVGTLSLIHLKHKAWYHKGDALHFRFVAVLPEYAGRHIATNLVNLAIKESREKGAGIITLSTASNNKPAIRLYQKAGFSKVLYWRNQDHDVIDFAYWLNGRKPSDFACASHFLRSRIRSWKKRRTQR